MPKHHSHMPHILVLQMILAASLALGSLLAASIDTPPGGNVPSEETGGTDALWMKRQERAEDFKTRFLQSRKATNEGHLGEETFRVDRAKKRRLCREQLRKANRDKRRSVLVLCMREDMHLSREMVLARSKSMSAAAGVPSGLQSLIIARGDLLADAMQAIIAGLDAGIYGDEEGLFTARKNLREKYALAFVTLLPRLQAEQSLAWISHLLLRSRTLQEEGTLSPTIVAKLSVAEACLGDAEQRLEEAMKENDPNVMKAKISQVQSSLISCVEYYRDAHNLRSKELAPPPPENQEPQWEKRSMHRLPKSRN